jgi:SAM-dependent methyltransferase
VKRLDEVVSAREAGDMRVDPYEVLWESLATAKATYGWLAPVSEPWLAWVEAAATFGGRVLDVGCGMGVHTCYYAWRHPDSEVVGVDRSPHGIARAGELAAELGLNNVRFLEGHVDTLDLTLLGGLFETVTASTFLVDAEPALLEYSGVNPWSVAATVQEALEHGRSDHVEWLSSLLVDGGEYLGLERVPGPAALAVWLGALQHAGLEVEPSAVTRLHVSMPGSEEHLPAVRAVRGATAEASTLTGTVRIAMSEAFADEDALAADPPQERLWGREFLVEDDQGSGRTRVEVLRLQSGQVVYNQQTSRGYRELWLADPPDEAFAEAEYFLTMAQRSPRIRGIIELSNQLENT